MANAYHPPNDAGDPDAPAPAANDARQPNPPALAPIPGQPAPAADAAPELEQWLPAMPGIVYKFITALPKVE